MIYVKIMKLPSVVRDVPLPSVVPQVEPILPHVEPKSAVIDNPNPTTSPESLSDNMPSRNILFHLEFLYRVVWLLLYNFAGLQELLSHLRS